jgi:hypothetical protein
MISRFWVASRERLLDRYIGAPLSLASARVREHIGPPFFPGGLLRVRPGTVLDGITRLNHGGDQPCDLGPTDIEQGEVRRGHCHLPHFQPMGARLRISWVTVFGLFSAP